MKRIRINNDFTFAWAIERNGVAENLQVAINRKLYLRISTGERLEVSEYTIAGNIISVEVTPELAPKVGRYNFIFQYELPDLGLSDYERLCEVDVDAFIIVPRTAEADDSQDLLVTSDMAIGFKGDSAYQIWLSEGNTGTIEDFLADIKGDPFTYDDFTPEQLESLKVKGDPFEYSDFTPEQIALLQKPASDIATTVSNAEELRVTAEQSRQTNTATAIQNAETATTNADNAASLANEKAGLANDAAILANEKAELAATATTQANTARDGANSAAQTANEAATNISPAVINNEQVQAETYNVLNARISALEAIIAAGVFSYLQANTLIGVNSMLYKGAEIFLYGTASPNIAPDFIGQFYINTTAGTTYQAKGIASAADWKQTSN